MRYPLQHCSYRVSTADLPCRPWWRPVRESSHRAAGSVPGRGLRDRHRRRDHRGAGPGRRRGGARGRRLVPRDHPVLPPAGVGGARRRRDLVGGGLDGRRGGRAPAGGGTGGGRDRDHQPTRDGGGLGPVDGAAPTPGHRLAGPEDGRAVRRAAPGRPPGRRPGEDGTGPRPLLLGHQDVVAPQRRGGGRLPRPRPRDGRLLADLEPDGGDGGRGGRHRRHQRRPDPPLRHPGPGVVGRARRDLRGPARRPSLRAPVVRPLRGRRRRPGPWWVLPGRRARERGGRRSAGGAVRTGLLLARDGQGHLRDR